MRTSIEGGLNDMISTRAAVVRDSGGGAAVAHVAVGLEPVLRFLRELASYDSNEFKGEYNSEFYINKGAQKSCFQNSLPTPVFPAA